MSQSQALQTRDKTEILKKIIRGDLSGLTPEEQIHYYVDICQRHNLDPLSKPFDFMEIEDKDTKQKKVILYANKECAAQLRTDRQVSITKLEEKEENGYLKIIAHASTPDGRTDTDVSAIYIKGLLGKTFENAYKKAVTQAKRRVTLSICGLGHLDETEVADVPNARPIPSPEDDAVMTEAEALTLQHKVSGLDQWKCGRALAMHIIDLSTKHKSKGMTDEIIKSWLPVGVTSRKDLDPGEAQYFIGNLERRLELFNICMALAEKGIDKDTMRLRLPGGVQSLKDLNQSQVEEALKAFTHWLNTYNQVVEGSAING